jgi:hypothetical protein
MCSMWAVEALTRAGMYDQKKLMQAVQMVSKPVAKGIFQGICFLCTDEAKHVGTV